MKPSDVIGTESVRCEFTLSRSGPLDPEEVAAVMGPALEQWSYGATSGLVLDRGPC